MSPLGLVIAIVLVDLLGFSIVMPLLAPFADQYHFSPTQIGWLFAAYPLAQLVAAPILGRLSDRFGRRPVLAVSQFGTALSFLILGLSSHYPTMLLARLLDGASGGNILVAQAYVADITKPEERSRGYGLIGMAFGLGFVLGPLLSLFLVELPVPPEWRLRVPFLIAAGFSTLAWVLVVASLPESLPRDARDRQPARVLSGRGLVDAATTPGAGGMILLGFLATFSFAALESTLSLFLGKRLLWGTGATLGGFTFLGLIAALVQGGMVRRLVPRLGEPRLTLAGLILLALGFACLAGSRSPALVLGAVALVGIGQGLTAPTVSGLLSRITAPNQQGAIFGAFAAAQTLARLVSYPVATRLFERQSAAAPYWLAATVALVGVGLTSLILPRVARLVASEATGLTSDAVVPMAPASTPAESLAPNAAGA